MELPLKGRLVALPETRELNLFAKMLEAQGATTLRCPMVEIHDAPDPAPIHAWIHRLIADEFAWVVLMTGEGVHRLHGFAQRANLESAFIEALGKVRKITRGPKPIRALRELKLGADLQSQAPTTTGVIASLANESLAGLTIGVQLYGEDPNPTLIDFLVGAGAKPVSVAPYRYASAAEDESVADLIQKLAAGNVDVIAFTSMSQVKRMREVAQLRGIQDSLVKGLERTKVAAVGPIVAHELESAGTRVDLVPERTFYLKPLVTQIATSFGG